MDLKNTKSLMELLGETLDKKVIKIEKAGVETNNERRRSKEVAVFLIDGELYVSGSTHLVEFVKEKYPKFKDNEDVTFMLVYKVAEESGNGYVNIVVNQPLVEDNIEWK